MITSLQNERVKLVRTLSQRKTRREQGRFFIEGLRAIDDALSLKACPDFVFYTNAFMRGASAQTLLSKLAAEQIELIEVSDKVMAACSDTETPPGILAVLPLPQLDPIARPGFVLIADALRDPGNLGALLRSAAAAGVDAVWLAPGTVDAYNPKVVRGAMGAHFRIPIAVIEWDAITARVSGIKVWLADGEAEVSYTQVDWTKPCALIVGGEAHGASVEATQLANGRVRIPMLRDVESLNAGVAASVILFEAARQRRGDA